MYINTVGFYSGPASMSGSPAPYSVTPFFGRAFTDNMGFVDRALNSAWLVGSLFAHGFSMTILQGVLRRHFGQQIPHVYDMAKNVSFVLQNGHFSVSYPRPYLPNVAEVACIHCKEPKKLNAVSYFNIFLLIRIMRYFFLDENKIYVRCQGEVRKERNIWFID